MSMPPLALPDPRLYPDPMPSNMLIHYTLSVLKASSDSDREMWQDSLRQAVADLLERDDVLTLSVALAMVPSQAAYRVLWEALRAAVEQPGGRHAVVFAVPLVLVAGAKPQATLPARIDDVEGLNAIFREHGVFAEGAEVFLSGKLLHPDSVSGISSAQLYRFSRSLVDAARGVPLELEPTAVTVKNDGVFLRYLVGVAIQEEGQPAPVKLGGSVGPWGIPLMKFLGEQLKTDGVTLFPIARPPLVLLQAMVAGGSARQEVALQAFASSMIRKLHDMGQEPVAVLSAHENNELRFTISAPGDEKNWEGFVWPLSSLDSVPLIETQFCELMAECQVRDVRVVPLVQADQQNGIPLFLTADDVPVSGMPTLQ